MLRKVWTVWGKIFPFFADMCLPSGASVFSVQKNFIGFRENCGIIKIDLEPGPESPGDPTGKKETML
jgi:hypothetical protein